MTEQLTRPNNIEDRRLLDGVDFYKFPMGQIQFKKHADAEVTFTMQNRSPERLLSEYIDVDELNARFDEIREKGFTPEEIAYLASIPAADGTARFDAEYLDFLSDLRLPDIKAGIDPETNELAISTTGRWPEVSLWETVVLSEVNEAYFKAYATANGMTVEELYAEGDRRLDEKIAVLKTRPDIKFVDFGTRRRFSARWQQHVVEKLARELPDNFTGTSNPWFAHIYGLPVVGTFAHEMFMVYAGLAEKEGRNPLDASGEVLDDWEEEHPDLTIALTDTFTTDFFFNDFGQERAERWKGFRHDSGDPIEFGHKAIKFLEANGVDPREKAIVFSDNLNLDAMIRIADEFHGKIDHPYGIGTNLTNDLGVRALNVVMKATMVNGMHGVKLSDVEGKHTGPPEKVTEMIRLVNARLEVDTILSEIAVAQ